MTYPTLTWVDGERRERRIRRIGHHQ